MIKLCFAQLKSSICSLYCSKISKALAQSPLSKLAPSLSKILCRRVRSFQATSATLKPPLRRVCSCQTTQAHSSHTTLYQSLSLLLSFTLIFSPSSLLAQAPAQNRPQAPITAITPDPSSTAPSLDQAPNGTDIINIVNPDHRGISNNLYLNFNAQESGLIFNNSTAPLTPTELAGLIAGNPHLEHSASLILNQVTSTSPSSLLGPMEVAGQRASLLIANPNGITCRGCGFINTHEATLTTASLIQPSSLAQAAAPLELRVERGEIRVDSLNALGSERLNLLSNSLKIDGELYARSLKVLLGSNGITLSDKGALLLWQPITLHPSYGDGRGDGGSGGTQVLALDVSHLGRVYANSIYLIASDKGAKIEGSMATLPSQREGDGGFYLEVGGELRIARPVAGPIGERGDAMATSDGVGVQGRAEGRGQEGRAEDGAGVAWDGVGLAEQERGAVGESARPTQSNALQAMASQETSQGQETRNQDPSQASSSTASSATAAPQQSHPTAFLFSSGEMELKAQSLSNEGYILSEKDLNLQAKTLENSSVILSKGLLSVQATALTNATAPANAPYPANANTTDSAQATATATALIQGSHVRIETDHLKNLQGFILAKEDLKIQAKTLENKAELELRSELVSQEHVYFMRYNKERRKHWKGGLSGRIWVSVLDPRSKDYTESIYEDRLESYAPSLIYAGNSLSIQTQILNNYDGQIGGEQLTDIKAGEFNNHATEAQRKVVRQGSVAQSYPDRAKCGWFSRCAFTNVRMISYNNTEISKLPSLLPTVAENLTLAPKLENFYPLASFNPKNPKGKDFSAQDVEAFVQSAYFQARFSSFHPSKRLETLSYLLSSSGLLQENLASLLNQSLQEERERRALSQDSFLDSLASYNPFRSERMQSSSSFSSNVFGKNLLLNSRVLNNEGSILASELIFAQTQERLQNTGSIEGGDVYLSSEGEISNLGGKLKAKESLSLSAQEVNLESKTNTYQEYTQRKRLKARDPSSFGLAWLRGETAFETYSALSYQSQNLYSQSTLSGSNISIAAATSLSIKASDLLASKNLSLSAKDISIQTLSLKQSSARETNFTSSSTSLLQSSLSSGGDLRVDAGDTLLGASAKFEAKDALVLSGKNIFLLADKEEGSSLSRSYSSGLFGASSMREERSFYSKEVGNSLKASNVILNSQENILSIGSNLWAEKDIAIKAKNFTSLASKEIRENSSLDKDRGALGFSSSSSSSSSYALSHSLSSFTSANLSIQTLESIHLSGVQVDSKENVVLDTQSFTLSHVLDERRQSSGGGKKIFWGLEDKSKDAEFEASLVKSSSISADSLLIQAKASTQPHSQEANLPKPSLTLLGSTLNIASDASLSSEGNLSILDAHSRTKTTSGSKDRSFKGLYVDFNRKLSAGLEFKDNESKTSSLQAISVGSALDIGGNLSLDAKDTLLIRGSHLNAKGSMDAFASNINIVSGEDTFVEALEDKQGVLRVGVEVGNAYVDLAYATKDLADASKAVDKARREFNKARDDYKKGKMSKEALKDYEVNLALLSASLVTSSTNLASSIASTASAASTSLGTGMYAGVSVSYQGVKTQSKLSSTTQVSSNLIASSISLNARDSITQASSNLVANTISYRADKEIKIQALANTQSFNQNSKNHNASLSFGSNGGGGLSGGGGEGRDRRESVGYVGSNTLAQKISIASFSYGNNSYGGNSYGGNSYENNSQGNNSQGGELGALKGPSASNQLSTPSGPKVSLLGSSLEAKEIDIKAKDLEVVSLQDSESLESKSFSANAGLSLGGTGVGGMSGGGGRDKGRSQRQWVHTQAKILGSQSVSIDLEDTLKIEGGVIGVGEESNKGERGEREGDGARIAAEEIETGVRGGERGERGGAERTGENAKDHTQASNTKEKYQEHQKQKDNAQGSSSHSYANNTNKKSSSNTPPTLSITAKSIHASHITNKEEDDSRGFYVSTSLGRNNSSIGIGLSGNTQASLKHQAREKEGMAYASIGSLGENARVELKLGGQDKQASPSLQSLESNSSSQSLQSLQSLQTLQSLGINTDLSATSITTKDKTTKALNASVSLDNNLLSQEGWKQIGDDFKHLGRNLTQVARGLKNNIITQSLINAMHSQENNLFSAISKEVKNYIVLDTLTQSILSDAKLSEALNGLTKLSSTEVQEVLQEVANIAGSQDGDTEGFVGKLSIYNNEEVTKGYAYSGKGSKAKKGEESKAKKGEESKAKKGTKAGRDKREEWIGFNTRTNDLTHPDGVINTLFHETSNKQKHHQSEKQEGDRHALTRGKTAESIFALKNYANTNTNTLTNTEWNTKHQGSVIFKEGNRLNKETWERSVGGNGERDNARIMKRPLHKAIYLPMSDTKIFRKENLKLQHQHIFFEDAQGGNIGFFPDGVHADLDQHLHTYQDTDGKHYDDKMMREAVKRIIPKMQDYNLLQNNCQDFIQKVLQEYRFIEMGK